MRGEQRRPQARVADPGGPSPRARGAGTRVGRGPAPAGTIPACAGSSRAPTSRCRWPADHPRVRGEQSPNSSGSHAQPGPSPRARGAGGAALPERPGGGTIPACAGSRASPTSSEPVPRDHPRVRGEQSETPAAAAAAAGPSPRARGAATELGDLQWRVGTIPACAGSRLGELRVYPAGRPFRATFGDSGIPPIQSHKGQRPPQHRGYSNLQHTCPVLFALRNGKARSGRRSTRGLVPLPLACVTPTHLSEGPSWRFVYNLPHPGHLNPTEGRGDRKGAETHRGAASAADRTPYTSGSRGTRSRGSNLNAGSSGLYLCITGSRGCGRD